MTVRGVFLLIRLTHWQLIHPVVLLELLSSRVAQNYFIAITGDSDLSWCVGQHYSWIADS
jgi:hypothetical protein